MDMSTIRKPSRFKKFLSGKGFYAVLALCLLVIAGVAFASFSDTLGAKPKEPDAETDPTVGQQVVEPMTDVPDPRTTTVVTTASTTQRTTVPTTVQTAANSAPLFVLPGSNNVSKAFSGDTPVYSKTMGDWRCHNGADFVGNEGMTVKAVADGTVKSISEDAAWGGVVVIDHGFGVNSRYCGVTASVKVGDVVKAADKLGMLSGVPCESADGCHLHLEIMVSDAYADPVRTIDREVKYAEKQE